MKRTSFTNKVKWPTKKGTVAFRRKVTKKRNPLKTWRNRCDALLTPLIKKLHPKCLLCGSETQVAHHHFKKSTSAACRYYLPNLINLCTPCHMKLHSDEILWTGRVVKLKGMEWLADLEEKKKEGVKVSVGYYKEQYEILNEQ